LRPWIIRPTRAAELIGRRAHLGQCLDLGLLDEAPVDLVPVVMGEGNRPFFGKLSGDDVLLGNPTVCVQGERVTISRSPFVRAW
jgi:hypothetical protein